MQNGAVVDTIDKHKQTPLFYAAREGRDDVIKFFISKGCKVNQLDHKRHTALFYAKKYNRHSTVKILVDNGAKSAKELQAIEAKHSKSQTNSVLKSRLSASTAVYNLVFVNKTGEKKVLTKSELARFKKRFVEVSKYFEEPECLEEKMFIFNTKEV